MWVRVLALCLVLISSTAFAASGDSCGTLTPPPGTDSSLVVGGPVTCIKLIDAVTVASDSSVIWVPVPSAKHVTIKVVLANNAGAACTFDDWGLYTQWTSTTPAVTNTFGAIHSFDDDGTSAALPGATSGPTLEVFGQIGPYLFVDGGTLGACANGFSIWAWFWPSPKAQY